MGFFKNPFENPSSSFRGVKRDKDIEKINKGEASEEYKKETVLYLRRKHLAEQKKLIQEQIADISGSITKIGEKQLRFSFLSVDTYSAINNTLGNNSLHSFEENRQKQEDQDSILEMSSESLLTDNELPEDFLLERAEDRLNSLSAVTSANQSYLGLSSRIFKSKSERQKILDTLQYRFIDEAINKLDWEENNIGLMDKNRFLPGQHEYGFRHLGYGIILERKYEQNVFAKKIDGQGTIGIFDNETKLLIDVAPISPADLKDNQNEGIIYKNPKSIKNHLSSYFGSKDENNNESISDAANTLSQHYFKYYKDFKNKVAVNFNNLQLIEQANVITYAEQNPETKNTLFKFANEYGDNGLKAFAACQTDQSLGDNIIDIGKTFSHEQNRNIFKKIAEVNSLAESTELHKEELFSAGASDKLQFNKVREQLLLKSRSIIKDFVGLKEAAKNDPSIVDQFIKNLEANKTEMIVLAASLKSAKEDNIEINIQDFTKLSLDIKPYNEDIGTEEKQQILALAQNNWKAFDNKKMAEAVLEDFAHVLRDTRDQKCYLLRFQHDIIGFVRFQPTDHETTFAGSFNVSNDLRGLNIGNRMMENALAKEGELDVLEASASIKIPAGCAYVEKVGFVADGLIDNFHDSGEMLFSIKLNLQKNNSYSSRVEGKNEEEIIPQENLIAEALEAQAVEKLPKVPRLVLKCNLTKDFNNYQKALRILLPKVDDKLNQLESLDDKYTMTRYWQDKSGPDDIRYLVFEKNKAQ